jgi:anti-sigma B factor antagonist
VSLESNPGTVHQNGGVLRLEGEIDLARRQLIVDDIETRLRQHPQLVIDVSAVTFIDCTGLGTLLWAHTRAEDFGGGLALVGPCAALSRILELTALDHVFRLQPAMPNPLPS